MAQQFMLMSVTVAAPLPMQIPAEGPGRPQQLGSQEFRSLPPMREPQMELLAFDQPFGK